MKLTWFICAAATWSVVVSAPQNLDARQTLEKQLPRGNVVTSFTKAQVQGQFVDNGQLLSSQPSHGGQGSSSVVPVRQLSSQEGINRQGILDVSPQGGGAGQGNFNLFISDDLRENLENGNVIFGNNGASNFGTRQSTDEGFFIVDGGNGASNVGVPLPAISGTQNLSPGSSIVQLGLVGGSVTNSGFSGNTGVPLPVLSNNAVGQDLTRNTAGQTQTFATLPPITLPAKIIHTPVSGASGIPLPANPILTQSTADYSPVTTPQPIIISQPAAVPLPDPIISLTNSVSTTAATTTPAPFVLPTLPPLPLPSLSPSSSSGNIASSVISSLFTTLGNKITNPSQTFGSFLRSISGQNGILVFPSSSLGKSGGSSSSSSQSTSSFSIDFGSDSSSSNNLQLDLDSSENDPARITIDAGDSDDTNAIIIGGGSAKADVSAVATTTAVETTTEPIAKTKTPVNFFRGPLSDILFTKGQWLGTLVGGLVDIGRTVIQQVRESRRRSNTPANTSYQQSSQKS